MSISGKVDITLKFSSMPNHIIESQDSKEFLLNADGIEVKVKVSSKAFGRLEESTNRFPSWIVLAQGRMGQFTDKGFVLDQATFQVFEKKTKPVETK